jgi:uncharacterized membrane protein
VKPNRTPPNVEKRFAILGLVLQALHVLFGVTAILGMFLTLSQLKQLKNPMWIQHCRWQLFTFWVGAAAYAVGLFVGFSYGLWWPFVLAAVWVSYRLLTSLVGIATNQPAQSLINFKE